MQSVNKPVVVSMVVNVIVLIIVDELNSKR